MFRLTFLCVHSSIAIWRAAFNTHLALINIKYAASKLKQITDLCFFIKFLSRFFAFRR